MALAIAMGLGLVSRGVEADSSLGTWICLHCRSCGGQPCRSASAQMEMSSFKASSGRSVSSSRYRWSGLAAFPPWNTRPVVQLSNSGQVVAGVVVVVLVSGGVDIRPGGVELLHV